MLHWINVCSEVELKSLWWLFHELNQDCGVCARRVIPGPSKAPGRSPSVERPSWRALALILLLVWCRWVFSAWRVSVVCVWLRDGGGPSGRCRAMLIIYCQGNRTYRARLLCSLEKHFPEMLVLLQCDDCFCRNSLLCWGVDGMSSAQSPIPLASPVLSPLNIN